MLEKFLSKLGAETKITVGVSVSPNVGLEMIQIDNATGIVSKYSCRPLEYNNSTREIANYEDFQTGLEELFEELDISPKCNIALSLPNVHFGMISLPLLLTDEAITNAIMSEAEQSYIFKRQEPVISWVDASTDNSGDSRLIAYSAIQQQAIDQINEVCENVGCTPVCIESSFSSLFRALSYLDLTKEQMTDGVSWNLMVIMQNNYAILAMSGKKIVEYTEEPLALKSFIDDEIYNAIKTSAQITLAGLPANYLYIVSETDMVSAEVLSLKLPFEGSIKYLESNKYSQNEIMPIDLNILPAKASLITVEAIGSAVYQFSSFPLKLNIIKSDVEEGSGVPEGTFPKVNIGNLEVQLTPTFVKKISLIIAGLLIIPIAILLIYINFTLKPKFDAQNSDLDTRIQSLNADIKHYQEIMKTDTFNVKEESNSILVTNKSKLSYYSALGLSVPSKLWIDYYETTSDGHIFVEGAATEVKSIYTFYKNLKEMVNNSDIKLRKLELASSSLDSFVQNSTSGKMYIFEITNMTDGELGGGTAPAPADATAQTQAGQQPAGQQQAGQPAQSGQPGQQPATDENKDAQKQSSAPLVDRKFTFQFGHGGGRLTPSAIPGDAGNKGDNSNSNNNGLPPNLQKIEKF